MPACSSPGREAMLTKSVRSLTLRMAAPSLAAMLATGFCTLLDALLLARQAPQVSAAVGVCFPLLTAQQAVGFTLGMGAGSHASRKIGEKDPESARQAGGTALTLALALGLMLLSGIFLLTPLLALLGAQADTLPYAFPYARYLLLSSPFACVGLVLSSLMRAQGKAPANMLAYAASGAVGAALDLLLIGRMGLSVHGAGVSLLAREILAFALLALFFLRGGDALRPAPRDFIPRLRALPDILRSGVPTLLRQGAASLSGALLSRVSSGFGAPVLAGMGLAVRAQALITSAAIGFGQGFSPVCGVNFGAGRMDRVCEAYRFCMRLMIAGMLIAGVAVFCASDALLALFRAKPEVAALAGQVLRAQSAVFFCQSAVILMNMLTQSMGAAVRASLVALSRQGIFLIPLLLILPRAFGLPGLILCQSAADVLAALFSFLITRPLLSRKTPASRR